MKSNILSFLLVMTFIKSKEDVNTVTGVYSYVSNPCTTKPCLPGMVFAVQSDRTYYYITVKGRFLFENLSWEGYSPEPGAIVTVSGYLSIHEDIYGDKFLEVEVISLQPAK
jgi:hypothetical protein